MKSIAVIGLGYVGLPLSLQFARSGVKVTGIDVDPEKIDALKAGRSYIGHIPSKDIATQLSLGRISVTTEFASIREQDAVIICVPTPLSKNREPDISFVINTGRAIAPHLRKGVLVVLESTTYPGTTDGELKKILEDESGLKAGEDFHLAYSPEREDPGRKDYGVKTIPKVVGGYTERCGEKCEELYRKALDQIHRVSSCRVAEATKLTENIFRSVNIALVNELKVVFSKMDIDIWEVIEAAKTKPFGYMPFYPGPGLGGHCIPIDPFYLTWKAREFDENTRFIELAGEVNTSMPEYVIHRVVEALNDQEKSVKGSRILILGMAYKPDVDDDRESPSYTLLDSLRDRGATLEYFDPHVPVIRHKREFPHWTGKKSISWTEEEIRSFDLVLIATNHRSINYEELARWANCIVDTRNAMKNITAEAIVYKA